VGNRLSVEDLYSTTNYEYDDANRLTGVDGVSHTWDDNGNLLDDGVNMYAYDSANRLILIENQQSSIENRYNGLGDRLQTTVDPNRARAGSDPATLFTMDRYHALMVHT
jgi:hypothetical protein